MNIRIGLNEFVAGGGEGRTEMINIDSKLIKLRGLTGIQYILVLFSARRCLFKNNFFCIIRFF
jgi:hypothetical protein